ncbi:MAG: AAA family ATPase [Acidobacteria bacterium]|nr:AAA family ATPase [Acidobacteriota bacterium]
MDPIEKRIVRVFRPSLVVLCGPAACGKSTFAARHFRPTQVISSDSCRALVCDDERDQRYPLQTFALVNYLVSQRLSINRLCVVDSTALTPDARKTLLALGRKFRVRVELFLFDIPFEKCLDFDRKRERSVGPKVIEEHFQIFGTARASVGSEGFDQVLELHEDDLEKIQIEILYRPIYRVRQEWPGGNRHSLAVHATNPGPRS